MWIKYKDPVEKNLHYIETTGILLYIFPYDQTILECLSGVNKLKLFRSNDKDLLKKILSDFEKAILDNQALFDLTKYEY